MKIVADSDLRNGTIKLAGEIDLCSVPQLRDALDSKVSQGRPALILDLTEVTFMDSSGLSVIISFWRQMQEHGGKLVIVGATGEVLEVFRLTNLDQYIPLFATDDEAWVALDMVA
ncbi:STAS domain-containing protein [Verrucomicrobiota bacterium sgz303538]